MIQDEIWDIDNNTTTTTNVCFMLFFTKLVNTKNWILKFW